MMLEKIADRYESIIDDRHAFLESMKNPMTKSFRVNTIKSDNNAVLEKLKSYGIETSKVKWCENGFFTTDRRIGSTLEHFMGWIYFQDATSMIPPECIRKELTKAGSVLDACAAPGSKTTQAAAIMNNSNRIVSNDINYMRTKALKFNLEKTGTLNTIITNYDLLRFPKMNFDCIILDVPCSLEGTIRKDSNVMRQWSEKRIMMHSNLQKQMILKSFDMLNDGGTMVYSTCTLAPEENESVVNHLISNRPAKVERIDIDSLKDHKGIDEWNGEIFDFSDRMIRVWPHKTNTGGFFAAKVRK